MHTLSARKWMSFVRTLCCSIRSSPPYPVEYLVEYAVDFCQHTATTARFHGEDKQLPAKRPLQRNWPVLSVKTCGRLTSGRGLSRGTQSQAAWPTTELECPLVRAAPWKSISLIISLTPFSQQRMKSSSCLKNIFLFFVCLKFLDQYCNLVCSFLKFLIFCIIQ